MDNFIPGFREAIVAMGDNLRFVLYFVCVAGLMLRINAARAEQDSLVRPIVRSVFVIGLIATLPWWFALAEDLFLTMAETFHHGYLEKPMQAAGRLRDSLADTPGEFSFARLGESLYRGTLFATGKLVVLVASVLQLPLLILHYILKLLCFLFLPVAFALFLVPSLEHLAVRYLQQTLAVLAWPVGFAVTELVAWHLLSAYATNLATAYGLRPGEIDAMSYASLVGALFAAVWLILGTLGTPVVMQQLFCAGSPLSGGGTQGLQQLYTVQQVMWLAKSLKTGGVAAVAAKPGGQPPGGGLRPPLPPPTSPGPAPVPVAPMDPSGDRAVAAMLASTRMPAPQTSF
ncbi:MAG: hypothetical protein Q8M02_13240 [Candidatus Didemnitutus sp.]|nr:hypothetical protein [Candidatus Didemnitutus sp.]